MQRIKTYWLELMALVAIIMAAGLALGLFATTASANPSYFFGSSGTGAATSSLVFMTAGTATTTEVFDSGPGTISAADSAAMLVQFTGSSTSATLNISLEYSPYAGIDCKANQTQCDWYSDKMLTLEASTTSAINLDTANTYTLHFASTTVGGIAGAGNGRITRIFRVATPTRYMRAVLTLPTGSFNGAIWGQFIGKKQSN